MEIATSNSVDQRDDSFLDEEFTEEDVLPFLLQAQDIIAKLESRVVELESDLSTIHRKYEHDRNEWLVGLSQKDQYINHLSSKLQKLEFNSKETIVQLSDLSASNNMDNDLIKSTITLCLSYLRQAQQSETPAAIVFNPPDDQIEDLEEGELERRQAALNEWRRDDTPEHPTADPSWNHEPLNLMDGLDSLSSTSSSHASSDRILPVANVLPSCDTYSPVKSMIDPPVSYAIHDDSNSPFCTNCKQLLSQLDQQIEQKAYLKRDLSSLASALSSEEVIRATVEQDKQALEEDVEDICSALFSSLNQILMDEVTDRDGLVQINRETTGKLSHVLDAWDARDHKLKQVKDLLIQLDSAVHQSANSSCTIARHYSQLEQNMNNNMNGNRQQEDEDGCPIPNSTLNRLPTRSSLNHPLRYSLEEASITHNRRSNRTIRIDGVILTEFQNHLKSLDAPNSSINSTPFLKRVLTEDVEPCLFPPSQSGWWKSPWFKRKLLNAIYRNKCEIQSWHDGQSVLSNTTTTSSSNSVATSPSTSHISSSSHPIGPVPMAPKTKCACCSLLRVCEYRMRLPPVNNNNKQTIQPWLPIDRFCRDRLVAVCDFYSFMSHLKLLNSSSLLNVFKQAMLYRRRMNLARVGSTALFDDDEGDYYLSHSRNSSSSLRRKRQNRESIVLDHSGSGSDSGSVVSISDLQGLEGTMGQIVIVH
ncbi:hypothetical protein BDB01DRAFT_804359 [Pilobolus umbonatus]|nr:hypothetical protein BDB01DRAFT_804359 [Pilobolus umbonatus]